MTRLHKLEEILANLATKQDISLDAYVRDTDTQWVVERGLELAASLILDVGNHILAGAFNTSVDEYERILEELWKQGVISSELYTDLRGLGRFRDVLVHGYLNLDPERVYENYRKALVVFPAFIAEIKAWLDKYEAHEGGV